MVPVALDALGGDIGVTRAQVLARLGDAQRQTGDLAYRATLLDAARLALEFDDVKTLVFAALANSRQIQSTTGSIDQERVDVLEASLDRVGPAPTPERARLLAHLASDRSYDGEPETPGPTGRGGPDDRPTGRRPGHTVRRPPPPCGDLDAGRRGGAAGRIGRDPGHRRGVGRPGGPVLGALLTAPSWPPKQPTVRCWTRAAPGSPTRPVRRVNPCCSGRRPTPGAGRRCSTVPSTRPSRSPLRRWNSGWRRASPMRWRSTAARWWTCVGTRAGTWSSSN